MIEPNASGVIFDPAQKKIRLSQLEAQAGTAEFWNDPEKAQAVLRERNALQEDLDLAKRMAELEEEIQIQREWLASGEEVSSDLEKCLNQYYQLIDETEMRMMLSGEHDRSPALLAIHPGAGGTESNDWAAMLMRMYLRYGETGGFQVELLDVQDGEEAGIKSATIRFEGPFAYGFLKAESGVHRLVRISPFDAAKRRHTSFCGIHVTPEIEDEGDVEVEEKDLRIDYFRASGAGGQHINTTDSAVRITHLPSGIVVSCQNERSQHKNRAKAMKVLKSRLAEVRELERKQELEAAAAAKKDIAWGSQIRSYVLAPYRMVKDHRTGEESPTPDRVLDGHLGDFIRAYLLKSGQEASD